MAISSSAVDGLVSGLDTGSIISQLLQVDAAPQTKLKSTVSAAQNKVAAFQSVNMKLATLQSAAVNLQSASAWSAAKATTVGDGVTATADPSAVPGSLSFRVTQLASGRSEISGPIPDNADLSTIKSKMGLPMTVTRGDQVFTVDAETGPLEAVVASINKIQGLGLTAVAVRVDTHTYRVQLTSKTTGDEAGKFVMSADSANPPLYTNVTLAKDAKIAVPVAAPGVDPIEVRSSSNTFAGLLPGVSVTATQLTPANGQPVTVSVATDATAVTASVKSLVDAANAALTEIATQSKAGAVGSTGSVSGAGVLRGDGLMRSLASAIVSQVTTALGGTQSAASFGVQTTRDGRLTFDADTFSKAYATDPVKVQKAFSPRSADPSITETVSDGLADRLAKVAKAATDPVTGSLTKAVTGQNDTISDLTQRIADWDQRLADKKARYQKYYASLEVSLGKLQSQSTWLSGQLASLNGGNQR
ncbi:flagellar filament capping protein FliD [Kineococcus sp. LSe6-4]|uniref:Flagellar hook-associated protein 2 n=1 Tax=Kineococcus halophytocola TaxID=3234027 RepID=A0ABV4H597_9ACTN